MGVYIKGITKESIDKMFPVLAPYTVEIPTPHGGLIDSDKLMEYTQNYKDKTISCNDIARFPVVIVREGKV